MVELGCAGCGLPKFQWKGNDGEGYTFQGLPYCCQGCAEGEDCTCVNVDEEK